MRRSLIGTFDRYVRVAAPFFSSLVVATLSAACSSTTGGTVAGTGATATDSLTGAWDLTESDPTEDSDKATGSLTISASGITVAISPDTFTYAINGGEMTASWQEGDRSTANIEIGHSDLGSAINGGVWPIALGGSWTFTSGSEVTMSAVPGSFEVSGTVSEEWPEFLPAPNPDVKYTGSQMDKSTSIFGDYGGTWSLSGTGGNGSCTVTFINSTFTSTCKGTSSPLEGTMTLTFNPDVTAASGSTGLGAELAANKR